MNLNGLGSNGKKKHIRTFTVTITVTTADKVSTRLVPGKRLHVQVATCSNLVEQNGSNRRVASLFVLMPHRIAVMCLIV